MLHIKMNNKYRSYEPQGLYIGFAAIVMRPNGFAPLSYRRIPGDGYLSV